MWGTLVKMNRGWRVWAHGEVLENGKTKTVAGFISVNGGLTTKQDKARVYRGCGEAIRWAQVHAIAITGW